MCRVISRDRDQTEHRVIRTDADITSLYQGMVDKFSSRGCIVPPPPARSSKMNFESSTNKIQSLNTKEFILGKYYKITKCFYITGTQVANVQDCKFT